MSRSLYLMLLALFGLLFAASLPLAARNGVYFSPHGGATAAIVAEIGRAKKDLRVAAYSFTSEKIALALIAAKARGVDVQVILDDGSAKDKRSQFKQVQAAGVLVYLDSAHAIMHNKVIIVDGSTLLTGSFNFSEAAEKSNAENLLILRGRKLASAYGQDWTNHLKHSFAP